MKRTIGRNLCDLREEEESGGFEVHGDDEALVGFGAEFAGKKCV